MQIKIHRPIKITTTNHVCKYRARARTSRAHILTSGKINIFLLKVRSQKERSHGLMAFVNRGRANNQIFSDDIYAFVWLFTIFNVFNTFFAFSRFIVLFLHNESWKCIISSKTSKTQWTLSYGPKRFFIFLFMHFCPGTMTTHADSINSDLQRWQTFTTHTTLNTEQNQLAIKVSADN